MSFQKYRANSISSICRLSSRASALFFIVVPWKMLSRTRFFAHCKTTLSEAGCHAVLMSTCYGVASRLLTNMFALDTPPRMTGPDIILVVCLTFALSFLLVQIPWDGYIDISAISYSELLYCIFLLLVDIPLFFFCLLAPFLFVPIVFRLIYRLLFLGSLSFPLRGVTGIEGTLIEFWSGYLLFGMLCTVLMFYPWLDWDSTRTHEPAWAEYLG
jgi:hypothetical protein